MPQDNKAYAKREKAYLPGKLFPFLRVGMTKVNLTPTVTKDTEGKIHYLIDGRRGKNYILGQVKERVLPLHEASLENSMYEDAVTYRAIDTVIRRYGFQETLMGTRILRVLLFRLYKEPKLLKCASKSLYPLAQPEFHITSSQVERNLRYAIRKSTKLKEDTRVITVLRLLLDATMTEVVDKYGRA